MRFDFISIILFIYFTTANTTDTVRCEKYNQTACNTLGNDSDECSGSVDCSSCYLLYNIVSDVVEPHLKGCWSGKCEEETCYGKGANANFSFCCCNSDNCNSNVIIVSTTSTTPPGKFDMFKLNKNIS